MIGCESCSMGATASLRGANWCATMRTTASKVSAVIPLRAGAVEAIATARTAPAAARVGTSLAARNAAPGTAVKTAAVRASTAMEFTAAGMAMPTTMRTATMGPAVRTAAMRTRSATLTEGWSRAAHENERNK